MEFTNLKFERRPIQRFFTRTTWVIGLVLGLILAWNIVPHSTLIWLLLPMIAALGWVASFGWRSAIKIVGRAINRLENL